ncbi:TonB-dependent siderophore receptor [Methylocystis bryophila]|nr:TonB-dependent siderophore receptor [Methylocystis bryophila]
MRCSNFRRGVSAAAMFVMLAPAGAWGQTSLPSIDIGKPKPVTRSAAKAKPAPHTGASRSADRGRGNAAPVAGPGTSGVEDATSAAAAAQNYGGAGPQQSPFNTSYAYEKASTGTKTSTPVMETPVNVQSVTQQVLRDNQVTNLAQALKFVSGVTTSSSGASSHPWDSIVIRGFATNYIYRDGFRLDLGSGAGNDIGGSQATQFANVQSIEVLKGAAAVLYGLSEPGGIVNIITKQPLDQPFYATDLQIGSLAEYRTTLDATGPLTSDKSWLYRINMSYENNGAPFGSFVDNTHAENIFVAPVVKWNIDNDSWVKLESQYYRNNFAGYYANNFLLNGGFVSLPRHTNYNGYSPSIYNNIFAALTWLHDFDKDWSIKQIIYYNRYETDNTVHQGAGLDEFAFPYRAIAFPCCQFAWPVYDRYLAASRSATQTLATEVNLTGKIDTWGAEHALLFGGDFYSTMNWANNSFGTINSAQSIFFPSSPGMPFTGPLSPLYEGTAPQDTGGLYAQDQVKLPYDLFFMAGVRYQYFRQGGGLAGSPSFGTNLSALTTSPQHADAKQYVTPRFGLLWRPFPWMSGYISYAEGFSTNSGFVFPNTPAPPTGARDAEAGLKFEFFDGKLRATVDYYDLTKTNVTQPDLNPLHMCGGGAGSCSIVVGEARSKGPEVDVQGEIYPGLNMILAYTNQSTAVTKTVLGDQTNLLGQPFTGIPRNVATLSGTYEFQEGSLKGLKLGASYHYNGAQRVVDSSGLNLGWLTPSLAGYGIVDLLADYPFNYDGWKLDAGVNIHNLFDRTYYTNGVITGPFIGLGGSYASRNIGDSFSVLGHIGAQWPGSPPAPSKTPAPAITWIHDWTGPYAGLQVGIGFGDNDGKFSYLTPDGFGGSPSFVTNAYGVIAGAHLGYNKQFDNWVVGLEGSTDVANLERLGLLAWNNPAGGMSCPFLVQYTTVGCGGTINAHIQTLFQGSLRARAGYAWNRLLLYGTGGLALGDFNLQSNMGGQDTSGNFYYAAANDRSLWRLGWTGGAGVEYAITPRISARAEYRYSDFGHIAEAPTSFSTTVGGPVFYQGERHVTQNQLQVGASYKFGGTDPEMFPLVSPIVKGPALGDLPSHKGGPLLPAAYAANWTGFYLGGQAGYGWGDNHGAYNYSTPIGFVAPIGVVGAGALSHDAQGVIFGAHAGYNRQFESDLVLGLEASVDGATLMRRETVGATNASADQAVLTSMVQSDIQGSLRGRAGYAFGRLLPYVTGGLAIGHFGTQSDLAGGASSTPGFYLRPTYIGFATHGLQWTTRLGWTVGGGAEWAVSDHWSIRGEYRYSEFGSVSDTPNVALPGTLYGGGRRLDQNQVQFGASYKFGDPLLVPVAAPVLAAKAPPIDWTGYTWAGLYAGGQVGMIWGANNGHYYIATPGGLGADDSLNRDAQVASVEGHVGYNRQYDHLVAGLEGSLLGTNLVRSSLLPVYDGKGFFGPATPGGTLTTAVKSNLQGSLRTRLGYAWGRLLPFVTGGVALGGFTQQTYLWGGDALGLFNASSSRSSLRTGWTLGAGLEWAMTRSWAIRGEYRYTDFGNVSDASTYAAPLTTAYTGTRRLDQNLVEFGVSYKFNEEGSAPIIVAADLPHLKDAPVAVLPPPGSPWRGFYAGVNAGGVLDAKSGEAPTAMFWDPSLPFGAGAKPNLAYIPGGANSGSGGALGGGQVGYNYQFGSSVVIGAEADIAVTSVSGGGKQTAALHASPFSGGALVPAAPLNTAQASLPYVGTLRGRAGYLVTPTLLIHTTAGFAYDGVDAWGVANTRAGWTVGGGAEWMFAQNWSAKLEYLFADISGGGISGGWSGNTDASFHPQLNILRGGLNYHFNSFVPEAIVVK